MAKPTAIIFTFPENLAQTAPTIQWDWDPDSNGNLYPFRQLRDNVVFNYPAYQTWIIYFYHCLTNHYTLLLRHVSTIRQGDFWKLLIVITQPIFMKLKYSALFNWLFKLSAFFHLTNFWQTVFLVVPKP